MNTPEVVANESARQLLRQWLHAKDFASHEAEVVSAVTQMTPHERFVLLWVLSAFVQSATSSCSYELGEAEEVSATRMLALASATMPDDTQQARRFLLGFIRRTSSAALVREMFFEVGELVLFSQLCRMAVATLELTAEMATARGHVPKHAPLEDVVEHLVDAVVDDLPTTPPDDL